MRLYAEYVTPFPRSWPGRWFKDKYSRFQVEVFVSPSTIQRFRTFPRYPWTGVVASVNSSASRQSVYKSIFRRCHRAPTGRVREISSNVYSLVTLLIDRVAGHPLLQTGSKVLCAFIQDPQWDKVRTLVLTSNLLRINGVRGCAFLAVGQVVFVKGELVDWLIAQELEFVWTSHVEWNALWLFEKLRNYYLAMFHFIQCCQDTNHGQEWQYTDRDYCEHKDFISIQVSAVWLEGIQMDMTRGLLSVSVEGKVAGNEILDNTCNWQNLIQSAWRI